MHPKCILILLFVVFSLVRGNRKMNSCSKVDTINRSLRDMYCDQPIFVNIVPRCDQTEMFDNICVTFFPLPDDPSTFQVYFSVVYCDSSFEVISFVSTDINQGTQRSANPFQTVSTSIFGYAGCETYLAYACNNFGSPLDAIIGLSSKCTPIGLSCLRKIEGIINDHCLPDQQFYVLPMKLPNRCVTQQKCIANPTNVFHKALGLTGPIHL